MAVNDLLTIFRRVHSIFKRKSINEDMVEHYCVPTRLAPLLPMIWQRGIAKEDMLAYVERLVKYEHCHLTWLSRAVTID
ncbi:hypothetical protein M514_02668 [Trichuris suis]|nr:hypothetical protein M514_02668 [Trichuris suis]